MLSCWHWWRHLLHKDDNGNVSAGSFAACSWCLCAVIQWKAPGRFLEDDMNCDIGRPPLAPPQVYEMYNLRTFNSLDSLLTECKKRQKTDAVCWMPVYRLCRDAVIFLLPGIHSLSSFITFIIIVCVEDLNWFCTGWGTIKYPNAKIAISI